MKIKTTLICAILIIVSSCKKKPNSIIEIGAETHNIVSQKIATLKDDLFLFGEIESFDFISKDFFVVSTSKPAAVILFDKHGNQIKKIGDKGKGPLEYQKPKIVRVHNNKIFIWDADQLKLIVYDNLGNPIREYNNFNVAIQDFKVTTNYVCFYFGGGFSGMVGVYDLIKEQYAYRGGEPTEEHLLLNISNGSGGITLFSKGLAYMSADQLSLMFLDFNNFKVTTIASLYDNEFKVKNIKNAKAVINSNIGEAIKYIMNNSSISGLFNLNNNFVIKAEVGKFKKDKNNSNDNSERFQKYYVLNNQHELEKIAKSHHDFDINNNLYSTFNNNIYHIKYNTKNNNFNYELDKITFEKIK